MKQHMRDIWILIIFLLHFYTWKQAYPKIQEGQNVKNNLKRRQESLSESGIIALKKLK